MTLTDHKSRRYDKQCREAAAAARVEECLRQSRQQSRDLLAEAARNTAALQLKAAQR